MKSIQRGLMARLGAASFLLALLAGLVLYLYARSMLVRNFDATLAAKATAVGTQVKREGDGLLELEFDPKSMPEFERPAQAEYFEIWLQDGRFLQKSASLKSADLPAGPSSNSSRITWDLNLPDGRAGRAIRARLVPAEEPFEGDEGKPRPGLHIPPGTQMTVIVAVSREPLDAIERILLTGLLVAAGLMALGSVAMLKWGIGSGLRPLRELSEQVSRIDATTLSQRLVLEKVPRELAPVCDRINSLLERVGAAFERERRFTSSVAHDLRTPLAELRTMAEVCAKWPDEVDDGQHGWKEVIEVTHRMEVVVATLLKLARCDEGREIVEWEAVDLRTVLSDAWRPFSSAAASRGIEVDFAPGAPAFVRSDQALLTSMLENLFSNAAEYCPSGGRISCAVEIDQERVRLILSNDARGLEERDVARMFEPFWRKDESRQESGHSGLGLTLVASYGRLLGIEIQPELRSGRFTMRLSIPRSAAEPAGKVQRPMPVER